MINRIFTAISLIFLGQVVCAQTASTSPVQPVPNTKIEAFSSKTGIVIIKGYSTIGSISGRGNVSIDVREFRDASSPNKGEYGIAIEVQESGRLTRESRSFIDFDEIDSLIRGIDYLSKVTNSVTQLKSFEVAYRTKGDFAITVYSDSTGGISLAIDSGRIGKTTAFLKVTDLETLKTHILEAKRLIESTRSSNK
jgi:hypothetical protein